MNQILGIAAEDIKKGDIIMIDFSTGRIVKATTKESSKKLDCIKTHGTIKVRP